MAAPQELYYKMTRPDGTDFQTGTVDYARALTTGEVIRHRTSTVINTADDSTYLSISATPGDAFGNGLIFGRLFQVKPVGEVKPLVGPLRREPQTDNWRAVLLQFCNVVAYAPEEFFLSLAKSYEPLPEGVGSQIRDATYHTGFFAAAMVIRFNVGRLAAQRAPKAMTNDAKMKAAQAFVDTDWAIITRGLIPAEYTALLMRTWRKTFGADYA